MELLLKEQLVEVGAQEIPQLALQRITYKIAYSGICFREG